MPCFTCQIPILITKSIFYKYLGEVPLELRKRVNYREPLEFADSDFMVICKCSKKQFVKFAVSNRNATLKQGKPS